MDNIHYKPTEKSPSIEGSISQGEISISGRSYPEDAAAFFQPFLDWLDEFYQKSPPSIKVTLDLDYFNTATSVLLYDITHNLHKLSKDKQVKVIWKYDRDDIDMFDKGNDFKNLLGDMLIIAERGSDLTSN